MRFFAAYLSDTNAWQHLHLTVSNIKLFAVSGIRGGNTVEEDEGDIAIDDFKLEAGSCEADRGIKITPAPSVTHFPRIFVFLGHCGMDFKRHPGFFGVPVSREDQHLDTGGVDGCQKLCLRSNPKCHAITFRHQGAICFLHTG